MSTFKKELNPKLYNGEELKPEVLKKLKEIAAAFIEFLEIPKEAVTDIVITGSSASYNYTRHSDIDLHVIVNPEKVHKDCPIVGPYLLSKKSEFNQKHDILIYGIPVEVYTELEGQGTIHNGLYSLNKGWIDFPKKIAPLKNSEAVKAKYEEYVAAAEEIKEGDLADKLLDKIKRMRKAGLEAGGEFSVENLVFKKLRDNGIIGKLMKIKKEKVDKELSLEESYEYIIRALEEMLCTSTAVMAPYPVDVVGRPAPFGKSKTSKSKKSGEKRAPHTEIYEECEKQSCGKQGPAMYKFSYKKNGKIRKDNTMDIFESLENLNVSEECFDEIMGLVEEYINELKNSTIEKTLDAHRERVMNAKAKGKENSQDTEKYFKSTDRAEARARNKGQTFSLTDKGKHVHSKLVGDRDGAVYYARVKEALEEISEMKKAREEYKRKGYFDSETDKKHIDKVYNAGFTLKDNGRGGKHVIEWERR